MVIRHYLPEICSNLSGLKQLPSLKTIAAGYGVTAALALLAQTDLIRAKKVIGDTVCIVGGMPITLLQTGTPEQVRKHTKKMIDILGKNGGYIMSAGCVMDGAKPELVKAWVEATREYGRCSAGR